MQSTRVLNGHIMFSILFAKCRIWFKEQPNHRVITLNTAVTWIYKSQILFTTALSDHWVDCVDHIRINRLIYIFWTYLCHKIYAVAVIQWGDK